MSRRILIVDDEPDILEILSFNLEMEGYEVRAEAQPCTLTRDDLPDLIIADVMMEPISGFEWAKLLKSDPLTAGIPIIFCTAKTEESDMLEGFGLGSDDYICKPFRIREVKARVAAVLRRTGATTLTPSRSEGGGVDSASSRNIITFSLDGNYSLAPTGEGRGEGLLVMDLDNKQCTVDGENVSFTKLEFEVLALLLSKPGHVFSREKILAKVWPDDTFVLDRTVDVNITRIRKKIGPYGKNIRTRFGYGYMFSN